jgi:hypothetical protein
MVRVEIHFTIPLHRGEGMIINKGGEKLDEIVFGNTTYLHKTDTEYDYLIDNSNNKIKVNLRFTKSKEKNEKAKEGIRAFFSGISS